MAVVLTFVCQVGAQRVLVGANGQDTPRCDTGKGSWQEVALAETFDPAYLDTTELGAALGAGFTVMATGLCIAWAARQVIRAIRSSL